jgi:Gas vesicle synthesis protein GvpL/GvpF
VIRLLAITDDAADPAPPVRAVPAGDLRVLCAPAEPQEATADAMWEHEGLIEELMEGRTLLPVRFGTLLRDEDAAAAAVAERRDELAAALERVRGAVELGVRVRGEGDAAPVHEALAALARDTVVRDGPDLLRAAYLVDRDTVDAFVALVRRLQETHASLALLCTGPWPPYSFAS